MTGQIKMVKKEKHSLMQNIVKNKYLFVLVLPALLSVFIFSYLPMIGVVLAFKDFDIVKGIWGSDWVGMDNFREVVTNPELLKSIANTLIYGMVCVFGTFPFPIILALMFNEVKNTAFKKITQTVSYMPHFISWIAVIGMFYSFFATEGSFNNIMAIIKGGNYEATNILMDSRFFLPIIFLAGLWKDVGWSSVIFLAAITGVDNSIIEAGKIDGCGRLKQIWYIILPSIRATIVVVLIMSLGGLFNTNFELVYGFQNVFTQEQTDVIGTVIYRQGIQNGKYSLATAFGISQGIVTMAITLLANQLSKKLFDTSIW